MRRRLLLILFCLSTLLLMSAVAVAADSDKNRVFDEADVFSDSQEEKLQKRIESIREKYNMDVVIRFAYDSAIPNETGQIDAYADEWYNAGITSTYAFGRDGVLFLFNMYDDGYGRAWCIDGCERGDKDLGVYFYEYLTEETDFIKSIKNEKYYDAMDEALDLLEIFLEQAETGTPYSDNNPYKPEKKPMSKTKFTVLSLIEIGVGLLFGKGYASSLRASMNTAVKRTEATEYIDKNSFYLSQNNDLFMYSNVTKTVIPTETRSSGGSGGTSYGSHSSGGYSHSSRSGRF